MSRKKANAMTRDKHTEAAPGTTDQRPRWEGPPENRPRGYKPAKDDPRAPGGVFERVGQLLSEILGEM